MKYLSVLCNYIVATSRRPNVYFSFRVTLAHDYGLIKKSERIFIPISARTEIKIQLHSAHLGYDSMLRRARDIMFWIGMQGDIKQTADGCDICQQTKPRDQKEPLRQHNEGIAPWENAVMICVNFAARVTLLLLIIFPISSNST